MWAKFAYTATDGKVYLDVIISLEHTVKAPISGAFIFYKNFNVTIDITTKKIIIINVT